VFYVSGGTDVLLVDTGQISTGQPGSPQGGYASGYYYTSLDYCPEDLKYCVTASGTGTQWWIESTDTAGDVVFATAGGQLSTAECYGKTCTVPPTYVANSSVDQEDPYYYASWQAKTTHESFANRFTWKTGWETKLSGLTKTVVSTRETAFEDDTSNSNYLHSKVKGTAQLLVCSGGQLWDFTELAVDTKTFDVTRYNYDVDPPVEVVTTYEWVEYDYCTRQDISTGTEDTTCGGVAYAYNYAKPVFPDPSGLVN
jgi:hypothetical protein